LSFYEGVGVLKIEESELESESELLFTDSTGLISRPETEEAFSYDYEILHLYFFEVLEVQNLV
jgi:hypothetical protein